MACKYIPFDKLLYTVSFHLLHSVDKPFVDGLENTTKINVQYKRELMQIHVTISTKMS